MFQYPVTTMFWLLSLLRSNLVAIIVRWRTEGQRSRSGPHYHDEHKNAQGKLNCTAEDEKAKEGIPSGSLEQEEVPSKDQERTPVPRTHRGVASSRQSDPGANAPLTDKKYHGSSSSLAESEVSLADHTLPFHAFSSVDDIRGYLEDLAKIPALSLTEEQEHLRRIAEDPRSKEAEDARHRLIEGNLRLVLRLARRYQPFGLPLSDLIQEGNLALVMATRRFDPKLSLHFKAFASRAVSWALHHVVEEHLRERHLLEMDRVLIAPLGATTFKALMRNDLDKEAATFDLPEERFCSLDALLAEMDTDDLLSDDLLAAHQYDRFGRTEPGQEDWMNAQERSAVLSACLESLTRRER